MADRRFTIDQKKPCPYNDDFQAEGGEQSVTLEGGQMAKLLRYIVHTLGNIYVGAGLLPEP